MTENAEVHSLIDKATVSNVAGLATLSVAAASKDEAVSLLAHQVERSKHFQLQSFS